MPAHPQAKLGALAATCARQAGEFLPLHNYLMRDSTWQAGSAWEKHAC
ncbi:MAG: hypothetical protein IT361_08390 [Gemmatimonadaceae bacterium]|nr:hypothetical protein [Gemmatimonadaceae bacterium]